MAQRTGRGAATGASATAAPFRSTAGASQSEERQSVPARARDFAGNGAERAIAAALMLEAVGQNLHSDGAALIIPFQDCARSGNTTIQTPVIRSAYRCCRCV